MTALQPMISVVVVNDSGMTIPERSVVVVTSVETIAATADNEAYSVHHVDQYGCGKPGNVMVTGVNTIAAGNKGLAFFDQFLYVSIDASVSDPTPGEEWGPVEGSWVITRNGKGFFAQGHSANGGIPKRSMFLRTFVRAKMTQCLSSSSSTPSQSSSSQSSTSDSSSVSGASSGSVGCGCITVVTAVSCGPSGLSVTTGQARGCC